MKPDILKRQLIAGEKLVMNLLDYFGRPAFLGLLLLLPVLWYMGYGSLAGLGKRRRWFALLFRTLVYSLLVFVLAQAHWPKTSDKLTVIYLLDQSSSIPQTKREYMLDYVYHSVATHRRKNKKDMAGVIIFGGNAKIEAAPFEGELPLIGRIESGHDLKTDATSFEAALKLAKASFPEDTARRIVVVSDGNENQGDGLSVAQSLAADRIGIDVVPVILSATSEVAVEKVVLPSDIRKSQEFEARVVVSSESSAAQSEDAKPVTGKLRITQTSSQRAELIAEEDVTLEPGKNVFPFAHKLDKTDAFTIEATFVPDDVIQDSVVQNNTASAFTYVRGKGRVLLIEDGNFQGEFDRLIERLQANAIEVDVMLSTELYESSAELLQYDSVILANVPRVTGNDDVDSTKSFSDAQIRMLVRNCEEMGCGIVMFGGDRSFGAGGWSNSELEKAMPVDFQIKNDKIDAVGALALMMHACEMADGNFWQTQIARHSIDVLGPMDYCGVVEWGMGGAPRWLWRMPEGIDRVHGKRKMMMGMVGRMQMGDMPDFNAPMRLALNGLKKCKASVKHMIIISDGDPTPPSNRLLQDFKNEKIKISTVLIGNHSMVTPMERIAKVTGGRYYPKTDPRALPKIFQREARRVAKPVIKESQNGMNIITDSMASSHEIMQGIDVSAMPRVFGYVMTTLKSNPLVEQLAISDDPKDNTENTTLLATWRYGLGRTTVFTADAGHKWTAEWLGSEFYDKLFTQMVRHSMRPITESANFNIGSEVKDGKAKIVVNAMDDDEEFLNFLNMSARGISPDLKGFDLNFSQVGPGRYSAEVDVDKSGNYLFSIFPGEGYERLTTGVNVPYSSEYSDRESNLAFLDSLVQFDVEGGDRGEVIVGEMSEAGRDDLLAVDTFRPTLSNQVGIHDIWPFLVVLSGGVFFADVFIRRVAVNFDFVTEYVKQMRSKKEDDEVESRISRLQSRKAEIEQRIESRRGQTRFAPEIDENASGKSKLDQVIGDEIDETADRRRPRPKDKSLEVNQEEKSYTSRLLEAKRKAKAKQKRQDLSDEDEQ